MSFFYLIFGLAMLTYGTIIIAKNFNHIIKDLKEDRLGVNVKFYGGALMSLLLGIYIIIKYIRQL